MTQLTPMKTTMKQVGTNKDSDDGADGGADDDAVNEADDNNKNAAETMQQTKTAQTMTVKASDISCLERYCTNILLACLTKVRC
jgi:hypothetical protein